LGITTEVVTTNLREIGSLLLRNENLGYTGEETMGWYGGGEL
jgi:hypothetical protein